MVKQGRGTMANGLV